MQLDFELNVAIAAAQEAGKVLLEYRASHTVATKPDRTFVTTADTKSSEVITRLLRESFPDHAILDEERPDDNSKFERDYCWIIDPLDDTKGYINQTDDFGLIIGLTYMFQPVLGVTYKPQINELLFASSGMGAHCMDDQGERRIQVSDETDVHLLVSASRTSQELEQMMAEVNPAKVTKMGGSLKISELAKGAANLFLCPTSSEMQLWDLCGTSVILQEAGGVITDVFGKPFDFSQREHANKKGIIARSSAINPYPPRDSTE